MTTDPVALYRLERARWQAKRAALMDELRGELARHGVEVVTPDRTQKRRVADRKSYADHRAKKSARSLEYYHRNKVQIARRRAARRRAVRREAA